MTPVQARLVSVEGETMTVKLVNGFTLTLPRHEGVTFGDHLLLYYDRKHPERSAILTRRRIIDILDSEVQEVVIDEFDEPCIMGMDDEGRGIEPEALTPDALTNNRCSVPNAGASTNTGPRGSHPRRVYVRNARCGDKQRGGDRRRLR